MVRWKYVGAGIVIMLMVAVTLYLSSMEYMASGNLSSSMAEAINKVIIMETGEPEGSVKSIETALRKLAHMIQYLLVGTVVFAVVNRVTNRRLFALLVFLVVMVPLPFIDEFYIQANNVTRSSRLFDVMIDLLGIGMALLIGGFYEVLWLIRGND